ncbi:rhomboid family intramembrane serine protease [Nonomuraea roseoviolacea]|uniref:Membrane associated rhomboid family serine protease n=1 Tax=Nonomuraea roseoviolacea subsp. carminata TaxID=160689 RepID=A0ABT1JZQ1_9ACTN|nr:rhomboid family intramembrane serine protease [Nonomuraea roseoviolacea]MCP2347231.1 membrane associated rhomboid family serine protease [Nonomuraea roseoviolacea subsp. carminata]
MTSQPPLPPEQPAEAVPTCYRHPERETWVRCQRCERPICPDCMRDAAVGFQCPECVAEGNKGLRQARSTFGGAVVGTPYVTWILLGLNIVIFGIQQLTSDGITSQLMMWPHGVAEFGQYHRLITSAFVHGSVFHVLFNCWALYVVGPQLERAFGHSRYLGLYLLSALGGSVLAYWLDPLNQPSVGASGAVYGLFGATFVLARRLNADVRGIAMLIGLNLVITFVVPGISWTGHIGGLITGSAVAAALAYAPRSNRLLWQALALAGALVVLVALVALRTTALTGTMG